MSRMVASGQLGVRVSGLGSVSPCAQEMRGKLAEMSGSGPLKVRIFHLKSALGWRFAGSEGRLKRFLYLEQLPTAEEMEQVRAAYRAYRERHSRLAGDIVEAAERCGAALAAFRVEADRLEQNLAQFRAMAAAVDPDFFRPVLDALGTATGPRRLGAADPPGE